jgi:hypothetical protein
MSLVYVLCFRPQAIRFSKGHQNVSQIDSIRSPDSARFPVVLVSQQIDE